MNKVFLVVLSLTLSCSKWGPTQQEDAVVEQVIYQPSQDYSGTGLSASGEIAFISGSTDDKYSFVFKCAHGRFAVGSSTERDFHMWKVLSAGDKVVITYRQDTERPGRLDFLSAEKKQGW